MYVSTGISTKKSLKTPSFNQFHEWKTFTFIETDKQNKYDNTIPNEYDNTIPNDISYLILRCSILTENKLAFDNVFKSTRSKAGCILHERRKFFNNCPHSHHLPVIVI